MAPLNDAESAIIATLSPDAYTAVVRSANNTTGIAVVEGFDLDADKSSKLANFGTRGFVQTGDNVMIGRIYFGRRDRSYKGCCARHRPIARSFWYNQPFARPNARAAQRQWRDHRFER